MKTERALAAEAEAILTTPAVLARVDAALVAARAETARIARESRLTREEARSIQFDV